jgi:hypothetical protein
MKYYQNLKKVKNHWSLLYTVLYSIKLDFRTDNDKNISERYLSFLYGITACENFGNNFA